MYDSEDDSIPSESGSRYILEEAGDFVGGTCCLGRPSLDVEIANRTQLIYLGENELIYSLSLSNEAVPTRFFHAQELLFRGALLPALGPDWRGVLGAGIIFGVLHISGGRKSAFGIWYVSSLVLSV